MTLSFIQRDILLCAEHLDQLEQDFKSQLSNLRETVQAKTAVPTAQVYVSTITLHKFPGCITTYSNPLTLPYIHQQINVTLTCSRYS